MQRATGPWMGAVLAGSLAGGMVAWVAGTTTPIGAAVKPSGTAADLLAITSEGGNGKQVLYLIDGKEKILTVYEYENRSHKLKLAAVRHLDDDQQLEEYNNEAPSVSDVKQFVQKGRASVQ